MDLDWNNLRLNYEELVSSPEIAKVLAKHGIFIIKNLPKDYTTNFRNLQDEMKSFFDLPEDIKYSIAISNTCDVGYFEFPTKECIKLRPTRLPNLHPWNSLPTSLLDTFNKFYSTCESIATTIFNKYKSLIQNLISSISHQFPIDSIHLETLCTHQLSPPECDWCRVQSWVQLLHYFPTSQSVEIAPVHTDSAILTLAFPISIGGLEISVFGREPLYIDIEKLCNEDDLLVFGGRKLELLTNHAIYALPHKVVSKPGMDRYSAPFKYDK